MKKPNVKRKHRPTGNPKGRPPKHFSLKVLFTREQDDAWVHFKIVGGRGGKTLGSGYMHAERFKLLMLDMYSEVKE